MATGGEVATLEEGLTVEELIAEVRHRHPMLTVACGDTVRYALRRSGVKTGQKVVRITRPREQVVIAVAAEDVETVIATFERMYVDKGRASG